MKSKFRLYLIGMTMGVADLIPGISGGTIAFISGIYEELLASIKTLRIQAFSKIAWPFLLPLGAGIATSILFFSKIFYLLLIRFNGPLYGFFFGMILASSLICAKEVKIKKLSHLLSLVGGAGVAVSLTLFQSQLIFGSSFFGLLIAGMLGTGAMLLPGISGSFLLQVIGVYPLAICALASPTKPASLRLLFAMGIGISFGFVIFSRIITFLLQHFRGLVISILTGFMIGGLKSLWPFKSEQHLSLQIIFVLIGFFLIFFLQLRIKSLKSTIPNKNF